MEKISRLYLGGIPGIPTLVATAVIVASYEPLRKRIRTFVDRILFRAPDLQMILGSFSQALHQTNTLPDMVEKLVLKLKETWKAESAGLALWGPDGEDFRFYPPYAFEGKAIQTVSGKIDRSDSLVRTLENERRLFKDGIISQDDVTGLANQSHPGERATLWKIRRSMRWVGASLCVPVMDRGKLAGFIILGQKTDRTIYNDEDKKILARIGQMTSEVLNVIIGKKGASVASWPLPNTSQISIAG